MEYDKVELIEAKAEKLLEKFLSDSDVAVYTNALYFLISIFLIAVCLLYVLEGFEHLVYILALLAIIPYKMIVSKASDEVESKALYNQLNNGNKKDYTIAKLQYLSSLVSLKIARIKALRLFYMICFPVWLYMLAKLYVTREFLGFYELYLFLPAVIISVVFWYYFFKTEIENRIMDKKEIEKIIVELNS